MTVLKLLEEKQIIKVTLLKKKGKPSLIKFTEMCDECYETFLEKNEVEQLIQELTELKNIM